jgi:hypothetical protein
VAELAAQARPAAPASAAQPRDAPSPWALTGIALALALGAFAVAMPLVFLAIPPRALPPPFPSLGVPSQHQDAETLAFVLSYGLILPAAIFGAHRVAGRVARGAGPAALPVLASVLGGGLAAAVAGIRLLGHLGLPDGIKTTLLAALLWWALAAGAVWLAGSTRPRPAVRGLLARPVLAHGAAVLALALAALTVVDLSSVNPFALGAGVLLAAAGVAAVRATRSPRVPRPAALALDAVLVVLVFLAVPDLVIFPPARPPSFGNALLTGIFQFHQDFLLGPANEALHGTPLLDGNASQYGVGSVLLVTGWLKVGHVGYGWLGLLDGVLTALWFVGGLLVLRLAGTARSIAAGTMVVAVVALVFNLVYPVGALPQDGPLRLGLPMAAAVAGVAAERWPGRARPARGAGLAVVGIASLWSLEGLAATLAVHFALVGLRAWARPGRQRVRFLGREAALALAACVVAHLGFALVYLLATGGLPDWGEYLAFLRAFLTGDLGQLTYDIPPWSPALAVGAVYAASAMLLVALRARLLQSPRDRAAAAAITAMTVYGVVLLYYFDDRSQAHILVHVSLPAVLLGGLWAGLLARRTDLAPGRGREVGLAALLLAGVLLTAVAWSAVGDRAGRSALARAIPGGPSLGASLDGLWHLRPLSSGSQDGVALLRRDMPGERRSLVITSPALGLEILLRSGRGDRLGLGDPLQSSFVLEDQYPRLRERLAELRPGDRVLLDPLARAQFAAFRANPEIRVIRRGTGGALVLAAEPRAARILVRSISPLQQIALQDLARRFRLVTIDRGGAGLSVAELRPR